MNYVLYHGGCYDGFGAALAAWLHFQKSDPNAVYMPVNYGKPPPTLQPGSVVYILDFSYPANVLLEMAHELEKVVVLDHHATAEKDLSLEAFKEALNLSDMVMVDGDSHGDMNRILNIFLKFDMTRSGAMLAWEYFHPGKPAPLLIQYLQDRDLWHFKMVNSRAISAFLQTKEMRFETWHWLMERLDWDKQFKDEIFVAGNACLRLKEQMVEMMANNAREMLFDLSGLVPRILPRTSPECFENQYFVPVANATVFFSEVGEKLLALWPQLPFAAYYLDRADGKRQWGLRSRPDFDCSVIAKAFGGGGHKQASGFTQDLPPDIFTPEA